MELNREQIIKACEHCLNKKTNSLKDCPACKYFYKGYRCKTGLLADALSLIKELTEENERLSQSLANSKAENERLKLEYAGFEAGAKDAVSFVKADTVRKMQERLKDELSFGRYIQVDQIDQIAKEMLENT